MEQIMYKGIMKHICATLCYDVPRYAHCLQKT